MVWYGFPFQLKSTASTSYKQCWTVGQPMKTVPCKQRPRWSWVVRYAMWLFDRAATTIDQEKRVSSHALRLALTTRVWNVRIRINYKYTRTRSTASSSWVHASSRFPGSWFLKREKYANVYRQKRKESIEAKLEFRKINDKKTKTRASELETYIQKTDEPLSDQIIDWIGRWGWIRRNTYRSWACVKKMRWGEKKRMTRVNTSTKRRR